MIIGVSFDPPEANKAFKEKFGFPFDLLTDVQKEMSIAYGAADQESARPSRVSVLVGADGRVAASYGSVTPDEHPDEVLADLEKLS